MPERSNPAPEGFARSESGSGAKQSESATGHEFTICTSRNGDVIYLLSVYRKSEQSTLSAAEKRILRQLVTVLKREPINASR